MPPQSSAAARYHGDLWLAHFFQVAPWKGDFQEALSMIRATQVVKDDPLITDQQPIPRTILQRRQVKGLTIWQAAVMPLGLTIGARKKPLDEQNSWKDKRGGGGQK